MTKSPVSVSPAEVIWTYLAHEHRYTGAHGTNAERFELRAVVYPGRLDEAADEMVEAVEAEVLAGQCDQAVLETVKLFRPLRWQLLKASVAELGRVWSVLPDGFPPHGGYRPGWQAPISDLIPGWLAYLGLTNEQACRDAETHTHILGELPYRRLSHRPILREWEGRTVIGDGRHRLFALFHRAGPEK